MNEQVVIQDALKQLVECEHDGRTASRETLARELSLRLDQLDRVLRDLRSAGLVATDALTLTRTGREYALHVLRAHRLYETYLARKTGVSEGQWHAHAHVQEHRLSADDVEKLDRDLDYPRFDPHGDPIPTATGEMPPKCGESLTEYPEGWAGRVVHVEDEPPPSFALIARASIAPGTVVRIEKKDDRELQVFSEGCHFSFSFEAARQITVVPLTEGEAYDDSLERLSSLSGDEKASVVRLSPLCRGLERSRLLDLGLVPGTVVTIDLVSPSGSPTAYRIRGASIALRREQAERILIRKAKDGTRG